MAYYLKSYILRLKTFKWWINSPPQLCCQINSFVHLIRTSWNWSRWDWPRKGSAIPMCDAQFKMKKHIRMAFTTDHTVHLKTINNVHKHTICELQFGCLFCTWWIAWILWMVWCGVAKSELRIQNVCTLFTSITLHCKWTYQSYLSRIIRPPWTRFSIKEKKKKK